MDDSLKSVLRELFNEYKEVDWVYYSDKNDQVLTEKGPVSKRRGSTDITIFAYNKEIFNYSTGRSSHRHEAFVINYAFKGRFAVRMEERECFLEQGDIYIMQPGTPHTVLYVDDIDDAVMISIFVKPDLMMRTLVHLLPKDGGMIDFVLRPFFEEQSRQFVIVNCDEDPCIKNTFRTMLIDYVTDEVCAEQLVQCSLVRILGLIARKRYQLHDKSETYSAPLRQMIQYIGQNFTDISLKAMAEHFSYNANYLSSLIRRETGQTFSDLVRNARMHNACFLLLNTDQSIDEIAECSGFGYAANFYRTFKTHFGVSPTSFRKHAPILRTCEERR